MRERFANLLNQVLKEKYHDEKEDQEDDIIIDNDEEIDNDTSLFTWESPYLWILVSIVIIILIIIILLIMSMSSNNNNDSSKIIEQEIEPTIQPTIQPTVQPTEPTIKPTIQATEPTINSSNTNQPNDNYQDISKPQTDDSMFSFMDTKPEEKIEEKTAGKRNRRYVKKK